MDTCGFINAIAAIMVLECYIIHCRLARALGLSSVSKHTCAHWLLSLSMPIDGRFSQYNNNVFMHTHNTQQTQMFD